MSGPLLYSRETIDTLLWPNNDFSDRVRRYIVPLMTDGVRHYIDNVETEVYALAIDDIVLPVTLNNSEYLNSYVCSPYTQYVTYLKEELHQLRSPFFEKILAAMITLLGQLLKWTEINRVVIVNNWLISTNLYPDISEDQIRHMTAYLEDRFPKHAIVFRSLHEPSMLTMFRKARYAAVASRQVYLWDKSEKHLTRRRDFRTDARLLAETSLVQNNAYETHVPAMKRLYDMLYLEKYSYSNPNFNENFFRHVVSCDIVSCTVLLDGETPLGVLGYFSVGGVMTTPILGYDTSVKSEIPLYRILSYLIFKTAGDRNLSVHASSGAARFKRNRGCLPQIEYSAVYTKHLGFRQKFGWSLLRTIVNGIGVPIIRAYSL